MPYGFAFTPGRHRKPRVYAAAGRFSIASAISRRAENIRAITTQRRNAAPCAHADDGR